MLKKNSLLLLAFSLSWVSSCATPPDGPVCVELSPVRGYCIHTIKAEEQEVNETKLLDGQTWKQVRETSLYVPAQYWGKLKAYLLKQCKKHKDCKNDLGKWETQADKIDRSLGAEDN